MNFDLKSRDIRALVVLAVLVYILVLGARM